MFETWVDGRVLNNTPIHAFDNNSELQKGMLGIRLDADKERIENINGCMDVMTAFVSTILDYATEGSRIRNVNEKKHTLNLDTSGLSTLDFKVTREVLKEKVITSSNTVHEYFNITEPSRYTIVNTMHDMI